MSHFSGSGICLNCCPVFCHFRCVKEESKFGIGCGRDLGCFSGHFSCIGPLSFYPFLFMQTHTHKQKRTSTHSLLHSLALEHGRAVKFWIPAKMGEGERKLVFQAAPWSSRDSPCAPHHSHLQPPPPWRPTSSAAGAQLAGAALLCIVMCVVWSFGLQSPLPPSPHSL